MSHDLVLYLSVSVVFCALTGLGKAIGHLLDRWYRPTRLARLALFAAGGWGLASLLSALCALAGWNQAPLAQALLVLGLLSLILPVRRELLLDTLLLLVLVAPMGLLVAGTPAMMFDEFAQWLPNTRYLVEHSHYWFAPDWIGISSKPGYPNGSAFIALLSSQMTGPETEAPFKIFVVMLLGTFGAALADMVGVERRRSGLALVCLLAFGCLVSFLDPLVDPRIGFSAHTDTPTALLLAIAGWTAVKGIGAARRGDYRYTTGCFAWSGLLALTLLFLRTTNLVLIAAVALAALILLLPTRSRSWRHWGGWALLLVGPAAVGEIVWTGFLHLAEIPPDMAARPPAAWDWTAPVTVLRVFLLDRLANNPVLGIGALAIVLVAILGGILVWRRLGEAVDTDAISPRLMLVFTGIVCGCFLVFLAWTYVAVFSASEVAAAASLWRYVTELGPLGVLAAAGVVLGMLPRRRPGRFMLVAATGIGLLALVLLPVAGHRYYSLDCRYPDVVAARDVVGRLRPALLPFASPAPAAARVAVVNPTMGDWMAYAMAFDLRWPASDRLVRFRTGAESIETTEAWAWDQGIDALLDLRPLDRDTLQRDRTIPAVTLLGRPAEPGQPWPVLATLDAKPLQACSRWSRP